MNEEFNFTKEDLKQAEQLTMDLIERARKGQHSKFFFLRSLQERFAIKQYIKASVDVARQFNFIAKTLIADYIASIPDGTTTLEMILTAKNCKEIADFYSKEAEITKDMCKEYRSYVFGGHFIDTLVGNYRTEDDLVDYRTLPSTWF